MTKKDGDKLRQMRDDLMKMSTDYRPLGKTLPVVDEASAMWNIADAVQCLLDGKSVRMEVRIGHTWRSIPTARR